MADSHEWHRHLEIPQCDLLLHAGDASYLSLKSSAIDDFDAWLGEVPARHVIFVPGNHDRFAIPGNLRKRKLRNARILTNHLAEIMGLRIWGSSLMPLDGTAVDDPSAEERRRIYAQIPEKVDILITHYPPYGVLDSTDGDQSHAGCRELLKAIKCVKPRVHIFGHVHGARGMVESEHTTFINATVLDATGGLLSPFTMHMRRL